MAHLRAGKDRDIDAMEDLANETGPLTVVVTWPVRKGREKEFEAWRHEIASAALQFAGHMGANVIRLSSTAREYVAISGGMPVVERNGGDLVICDWRKTVKWCPCRGMNHSRTGYARILALVVGRTT